MHRTYVLKAIMNGFRCADGSSVTTMYLTIEAPNPQVWVGLFETI